MLVIIDIIISISLYTVLIAREDSVFQGTLRLREGRERGKGVLSDEMPQNLFLLEQRDLLFPEGSTCLLDNLGLQTKAKSIPWAIASMAKSS